MAIRDPPKPASWTERDGITKAKATVTAEVREVESYPWGDFCRVIQTLQKEGKTDNFIRIGYYVKNHGAPDADYIWGSQTTVMIGKEALGRLIEKAKKKQML